MIRRGEEDLRIQGGSDVTMGGEFLAVVEGDGVNEAAYGFELVNGSMTRSGGRRASPSESG